MPTCLRNISLKLRAMYNYLATLRPLLRLLWQASPPFFLLSLLLTLLSGILPAITIFVTSALLQMLAQATILPVPRDLALPAQFVFLLVLMAVANLLTQVFQYVNTVLQELHRTRCANHVQLLILKKAAEIDLACFEDPEFHNRMRTAANEASFRIPMFIDQLLQMLTALTMFVSLAAILLFWQAWVVPVICLASLVGLWVSTRFGTKRVQLVSGRAEIERKKFYFTTLLTSDQAAKEIRLFGLRDFLLSNVRDLLETTYQQDRRLAFRTMFYSGASGLLLAIVQLALLAFAAFQAVLKTISIGQFNLYMQSILQLEGVLKQLSFIQGGLHESNLFAAQLFDFLAELPRVEALRPVRVEVPAAPSSQSPPQIEFRDVSFRYPGTERMVLKHVSFTFHPGEVIALVGENGAGKTTLVKLLTGLYEPTEGQILLNDVDIHTLDRACLRSYLSVIFQDYTVYHLSARENIGVGEVSLLNDSGRIEKAAQQSGLDEVIAQLPDGYQTVLGRFWEKGHELSGGQRQLVALARALLRDAPILLLDEPSAALDIYTEQHFFSRLLENRRPDQSQTVIFISHRFTTVHRADRILVMEHGCLIEQGSHKELMQQGAHYADMFTLQAAPYNGMQPLAQTGNGA